jgi:multidrug/hemolysin transport system permease protein
MKTIWHLTKRNILMYIKDKAAVFFSLLSAFIMIGLYAVFLAETNIQAVLERVHVDRQLAAYLINSWVMAGIIIVNTVTVTLGVIGIMIEDEVDNRLPAFLVAPISRFKLTSAYILSAFIVGNALCFLTFMLSMIYLTSIGGSLLTLGGTIKALGYIVINVFSSTCLVFFVASLIRSRNAFSIVSTLIGTLIGFVAGIYVPVGILPQSVQTFVKLVPVFYGVAQMRELFMVEPVIKVFSGAPQVFISDYLKYMGVTVYWNDTIVSNWVKTGIILGSGLLFLLLSTLMMSKRRMHRI